MSERYPELSFRAQSLDNLAPDPMEVNGCPLEAKDEEERKRLGQRIAQVSKSGTRVFSEGPISAFRLGNKFILEIPSDQKDSAGRIAPIICYGHVSRESEKSWPDEVVRAIRDFANQIGRGVSDQAAVRRGIEAVLKKKWISRLWVRIKEWLSALGRKIRRHLALPSLSPQSLKKR